jgi:hypothetical protein
MGMGVGDGQTCEVVSLALMTTLTPESMTVTATVARTHERHPMGNERLDNIMSSDICKYK